MAAPPLVIAHRGFSARYPENTCAAIDAAIDAGADMVEIDVQETADGQIVVFHDYRLRRLCGLDARIDQVTLADVQKANPDVPRLQDVLQSFRGRTKFLIELKRVDARKVVSIVQRTRMEGDAILFAFSTELIESVAEAGPRIERFGLFARDLTSGVRDLRSRIKIAGVGIGSRLVTRKATITRLHASGLRVFVWTVNSRRRMRQLADWGVDGIITNHPDRARDLFPPTANS